MTEEVKEAIRYFSNFDDKQLRQIRKNMRARCYNPNATGYANYGGKGITICDEWQEDFIEFKIWALSNGYEQDLTIDRIDSDKNYEPSNCRWITKSENSRLASIRGNSKNRPRITVDIDEASEICEAYATGEFSQEEIAKELNVTRSCIKDITNEADINIRQGRRHGY